MVDQQTEWLSQDELIFDRMVSFHRDNVEKIASGKGPISQRNGGVLVVHLIPRSCVQNRIRFMGTELKEYGGNISPLGNRGAYSRFNVDGFMNYEGQKDVRAYSQLFRDGRLEAAMDRLEYEHGGHSIIRESDCELAMFNVVSAYLTFCKAIDLKAPIWMFSALVDCHNLIFAPNPHWIDQSTPAIDRSPAFLPEVEITSFDIQPKVFLRSWCDSFWQAGGVERSLSYDKEGNWQGR